MNTLIQAHELLGRMGEPGLTLVDVRPEVDWRAGTIPRALNLDVYDYFISASDKDGIEELAADAIRAFAGIGVDEARTNVYFEESTGMISPRGLWFHEFVGLHGGLILDGGFSAWKELGGPIVPGSGRPAAIESGEIEGRAPHFRGDLIATTKEVQERDPTRCDLLDVRRRTEFEGSFVHPCCARAGRIPDAKFMFWEDFLDSGRYLPAGAIFARAKAAGLSPDREVITYCHRGARAATAIYGLRLAGFPRAKVYVGSWHEWAGDASLPICTGP
jgi:thiosulfate/3-mercaptopyruvate sulfurtransferase